MNATAGGSAMRQRNVGLQALRGLAAGAVVIYHAAHFTAIRLHAPWLESIFNGDWGYYGVMVFFVLSGFLMESAVRHYGPSKFLFHRFLRLFPTYWLLFLCLYLAQAARLQIFSPVPWRALTLLPLGEMYRPLGVEWTLLYEVFFYGVCTLLCFRRRLFPYVMVAWLAVVIDATYRHHQFGTVFQPIITQIPFSLWNVGFIFGAMAGVFNRISRLPDASILWLIGLALVSVSIAAPQPLRMFIASVGIASIVVALSRTQSPHVSPIGMPLRVLFLLGEYSYGMYLAHSLSIQIALQYVPLDASPLRVYAGMLGVGLGVGVIAGLLDVNLYRRLKSWADNRAPALPPRVWEWLKHLRAARTRSNEAKLRWDENG